MAITKTGFYQLIPAKVSTRQRFPICTGTRSQMVYCSLTVIITKIQTILFQTGEKKLYSQLIVSRYGWLNSTPFTASVFICFSIFEK